MILSPSQLMSVVLIFMGAVILLYKKNLIFKNCHNKMQQYIALREGRETCSVQNQTVVLLKELKELLDQEIITQQEFDDKKAELLKRL